MAEVIRAKALQKRYRSVEALRGLDLEIPEAAIYALVGPNGAGKTTAIKILINAIRPTGGFAEVLGIDSTELNGEAFESIGYVSENQDLPGWMRVDRFLSYLRAFYPTWDREREAELVYRFDLPMGRRIRQLSRGMQMKVALTSALAYRPKVIILDEPFSGLDPLVRDELTQALAERAAETAVFISSHDLGEVEALATHVGFLDRGKLRFSESMQSLVQRFRSVEVRLVTSMEIPPKHPDTWLQIEHKSGTVRFVASRFEQTQTTSEIHSLFGGEGNVTFHEMSLRDIFLAVARDARGPMLAKGQSA